MGDQGREGRAGGGRTHVFIGLDFGRLVTRLNADASRPSLLQNDSLPKTGWSRLLTPNLLNRQSFRRKTPDQSNWLPPRSRRPQPSWISVEGSSSGSGTRERNMLRSMNDVVDCRVLKIRPFTQISIFAFELYTHILNSDGLYHRGQRKLPTNALVSNPRLDIILAKYSFKVPHNG